MLNRIHSTFLIELDSSFYYNNYCSDNGSVEKRGIVDAGDCCMSNLPQVKMMEEQSTGGMHILKSSIPLL